MKTKTLVVAGGGAAGFFAAINAAEMSSGLQVILLEKTQKLLSKVRISGGGRCNVTHSCFEPKALIEKYPRGKKELTNGFFQFNPMHTIEWFAQRGVKLKTEEDGRMFPVTDNSETIIQCFLKEAETNNVVIKIGVGIESFSKANEKFTLQLTDRTKLETDFLLIATGGSPSEKNYQWLAQTGHSIIPPVPSLFTFNVPQFGLKGLEGVAVQSAKISLPGTHFKEQGPLLVTHWGISGPAAIRLSAWAAHYFFENNYHVNAEINFIPDQSEEILKEKFNQLRKSSPQKLLQSKIFNELPNRLWERLCELSGINHKTQFANLSNSQLRSIIENLLYFKIEIQGKTTYKEEFVTSGGIDLKNINMKTMESKLTGNLYFAGEVLNVDGITGGFNFQAAWTTAMLAARAIVSRC